MVIINDYDNGDDDDGDDDDDDGVERYQKADMTTRYVLWLSVQNITQHR